MFNDWVLYFNIVDSEYVAPWGKDEPNPILVNYFEKHPIPQGASILDSGCAHGRNTKYFLDKGHQILGVDISAMAINEAIETTECEDAFMINNVLNMAEFLQYDYIIDDGCLHIMDGLKQYELIDKYKRLMKAGSQLFIIAFMNETQKPLFYITDEQKMPTDKPAGHVSLPVYGITDEMIDHLARSFNMRHVDIIKSRINPYGIINLVLTKEK